MAAKHAKAVKTIVDRYLKDRDFEGARSALHELPFEAMREVLALATKPRATARELLVMVLADASYPPAFPQMRAWLDDPDIDDIVMPALSALDGAAGDVFGTKDLWSDGRRPSAETIEKVRGAWDRGEIRVETEEAWRAEKNAARERDERAPAPPSPLLDAKTSAKLRPDIIALKDALAALPLEVQFTLDAAAIARVRHIYTAHAPDQRAVPDALDALERCVLGEAVPLHRHADPVTEALRRANALANWSKFHQRWRDNGARAAQEVAQGLLYALSPIINNRLQPMHKARGAIEYAGGGYEGVRAELDWQLDAVRRATSG